MVGTSPKIYNQIVELCITKYRYSVFSLCAPVSSDRQCVVFLCQFLAIVHPYLNVCHQQGMHLLINHQHEYVCVCAL